jgi:hypothetical protein
VTVAGDEGIKADTLKLRAESEERRGKNGNRASIVQLLASNFHLLARRAKPAVRFGILLLIMLLIVINSVAIYQRSDIRGLLRRWGLSTKAKRSLNYQLVSNAVTRRNESQTADHWTSNVMFVL